METNVDNLDPKNININFGDLTFRELAEDDYDAIKDIIKKCAIVSTKNLYSHFLDNPDKIKSEMDANDKTLLNLIPKFLEMKERFSQFAPDGQQQYNNILDYIKYNIPEEFHFATYGPILFPFEEGTEKYLNESINKRIEPHRILFRLGVAYREKLIGCFVFDYGRYDVFGCQSTGDIGIFIDPNFREINNKDGTMGRRWKDIFYGGSLLLKYFFPFPNPDSWYICATTHPLNYESKRILRPENGFKSKGIKLSKYTVKNHFVMRKHFVAEYRVFLDTFANKQADKC